MAKLPLISLEQDFTLNPQSAPGVSPMLNTAIHSSPEERKTKSREEPWCFLSSDGCAQIGMRIFFGSTDSLGVR